MIDIGANLTHESFAHDRDAVIARAAAAGLSHIVLTGSCAQSNHDALELARARTDMLSCTAGLHPHHASDWNDGLAGQIRSHAADPACRAVGECGLDYFRDLSPRDDQARAFRAQLDIAVESRRPVFLHQRDAHADFLAILREYRPQLADVCVHCFTDTREAMEAYLALDCYIGITGWICDERRGNDLVAAVPHIPAHRLLIETDAPYLLPRNLPRALRKSAGRRNEPAYLPWVRDAVAEARGESPETVEACTTANAERFFGLTAEHEATSGH
ncbi:TatD family hydrolase [Algiphilus sp.]|uniref:TatD family hydrolase n=1 Tax=Algiphilus sp. TaxID=1872431 RepID=UPI003B52E99D